MSPTELPPSVSSLRWIRLLWKEETFGGRLTVDDFFGSTIVDKLLRRRWFEDLVELVRSILQTTYIYIFENLIPVNRIVIYDRASSLSSSTNFEKMFSCDHPNRIWETLNAALETRKARCHCGRTSTDHRCATAVQYKTFCQLIHFIFTFGCAPGEPSRSKATPPSWTKSPFQRLPRQGYQNRNKRRFSGMSEPENFRFSVPLVPWSARWFRSAHA